MCRADGFFCLMVAPLVLLCLCFITTKLRLVCQIRGFLHNKTTKDLFEIWMCLKKLCNCTSMFFFTSRENSIFWSRFSICHCDLQNFPNWNNYRWLQKFNCLILLCLLRFLHTWLVNLFVCEFLGGVFFWCLLLVWLNFSTANHHFISIPTHPGKPEKNWQNFPVTENIWKIRKKWKLGMIETVKVVTKKTNQNNNTKKRFILVSGCTLVIQSRRLYRTNMTSTVQKPSAWKLFLANHPFPTHHLTLHLLYNNINEEDVCLFPKWGALDANCDSVWIVSLVGWTSCFSVLFDKVATSVTKPPTFPLTSYKM